MPDLSAFDYAIVRVVPRVERGEFINVGIVLHCSERSFLRASIELDRERLAVLDPCVDLGEVEEQLSLIPMVCSGATAAGPIAQLPMIARFNWLVSPRSTVIEMSPVHAGLCVDPEVTLARLVDSMVRRPA